MVQKIEATDVTEEEALNAAFFERADEFIKQANEYCRVEKGSQEQPTEKRGQVSASMLFAAARFYVNGIVLSVEDDFNLIDARDKLRKQRNDSYSDPLADNQMWKVFGKYR